MGALLPCDVLNQAAAASGDEFDARCLHGLHEGVERPLACAHVMRIGKHTVVTFEHELRDSAGHWLDSSADSGPLTYVHGLGTLVPGLEAALVGHAAGDSFSVVVPPEHAYGWHDPKRVDVVPRRSLDPAGDVAVGMRFESRTEKGIVVATVTALEGENARVDANHPLAGIELHFTVRVLSVRPAARDEIDRGHAH